MWKNTSTPPPKIDWTPNVPSAGVKVWVTPCPTKSPGWLCRFKKLVGEAALVRGANVNAAKAMTINHFFINTPIFVGLRTERVGDIS